VHAARRIEKLTVEGLDSDRMPKYAESSSRAAEITPMERAPGADPGNGKYIRELDGRADD